MKFSRVTWQAIAATAIVLVTLPLRAPAQSLSGCGNGPGCFGRRSARSKVELREPTTKTLRTTVSRSEGSFLFPTLPPGEYELTVRNAGFQTVVQTGFLPDRGSLPASAAYPASGTRRAV